LNFIEYSPSFVIFIIYFICKELIQWKRGGFGYLSSYWNLAEVVIILAALVSLSSNILMEAVLKS
jgi:hypothetical protein